LFAGCKVVVLVDGYNVLKLIYPGIKGKLEKQRMHFIRQLGYYKTKKSSEISEIIVVFDAGPFNHASREIKHDVVIMFSGQKSTADDWIVNYVERKKGQQIILVTKDRNLIDRGCKLGCEALDSLDFYKIVQNCLLQDVSGKRFLDAKDELSSLQRYEESDVVWDDDQVDDHDKGALDLLMENASLTMMTKDECVEGLNKAHKKGNSQRLSKKEKEVEKIFKKLR